MFDRQKGIAQTDPELWTAMQQETTRQEDHIELIASENYASPAVMEAQGSQLTNKYAEGYPGKRYYGGCEYVDVVEDLAIERLKKLFGAEAANVQPNSGSQANQAVFLALLQPGDTITLYDNGAPIASVVVGPSGAWSLTPAAPGLSEGTHSQSLTATDPQGTESNPTTPVSLTIDTQAPSTTAEVTGIADNVGIVTGNVASGGVTDDTNVVVSGQLGGASAGASLATGETLRVYDGATFLGTATVSVVAGGQSTWSYTDTRTLSHNQVVSYTARVADAAGNQATGTVQR